MRLEPRFQIPDDPKEAIKALSERLRVLEDLVQKTTVAQTKLVTAEPAKPRDGMFAYADGVNWDPGAGRGLYQYVNATWQPVSAPRPEIPVQIPQTPWAQDVDAAGYNLTNLAELHGAGATNILKFFTSGAEAARFDASGNLVFATGKYITQDTWTEPTLLNGWVPFIAETPARYRKDKQGKVHLSGFIKSGTFADGTTIFNLSAECTPTHGASFGTKESGGGALARIELTAGSTAVKVQGLTANGWLMLDGLSFFLD